MKKFLLSLAVVASMMMAACGTKTADNKEAEAQATEVVDQLGKVENESQAQDIVTKAQTYVQELVQAGKVEEAKAYLDKISATVESTCKDYPAVMSIFDAAKKVVDTAAAVPGAAVDAAKEANDSLKNAVNEQVEGAKEAANQAVQNQVDAANAAVDKAAKDAADATNKAVKDAADATNNAIKDGTKKADEAVKGLFK